MDKEPYVIRYFFDHIYCLWSENAKARDEFNYPVDLRDLPLTLMTIQRGERLIAFWDGLLNWGTGQPDWSAEKYYRETASFKVEALDYFEVLQVELGENFILRNVFKTWEPKRS